MSNVQLSGTLERIVARRMLPLFERTGACRSLFGPVDHDEVRVELRSKLGEISERDQTRWNFDFKEDVPLPGRYAWEDVHTTIVPSFYLESVQIGRRGTLPKNEPLDGEKVAMDHKDVRVSVLNENSGVGHNESSINTDGTNQENSSDHVNVASRGCAPTPSICRVNISTSDSSRIYSAQATDLFPRTKRGIVIKESDPPSHIGVTIPLEQTPRKRLR